MLDLVAIFCWGTALVPLKLEGNRANGVAVCTVAISAGYLGAASVAAVVGDADPFAPHAEIAASLGRFAAQDGEHEGGVMKVVPGLAHEVGEPSVALGLAFLAGLKLDAAPRN